MRESALARLGRALADPTRCRILVALLDGVCYPGQLAAHLGLTRSNVSNHLSCLRGCGLVVATYEGRHAILSAIIDAETVPAAAVPAYASRSASNRKAGVVQKIIDWSTAIGGDERCLLRRRGQRGR
ncbi:ArsR/SmtB family transcription factor [Mycobacterium tuberculosis]